MQQRRTIRRLRQRLATVCGDVEETLRVLLATTPTPWVTALLHAEAARGEDAVRSILPAVDELFPLDNLAMAQCELMVRLRRADGDREAAWALVDDLGLEDCDWEDNDLQSLTGSHEFSGFLRDEFGDEHPGLACWLDVSQAWSLYWEDDATLETTRRRLALLRRGLDQLADLHGPEGAIRAGEEVLRFRDVFRDDLLVRAMLTDLLG